jgi:hypothetical protein
MEKISPRATDDERRAAADRLSEIRRLIGRLDGFSTLEQLRRDRDRDNEPNSVQRIAED